jgi:hypothetical protein
MNPQQTYVVEVSWLELVVEVEHMEMVVEVGHREMEVGLPASNILLAEMDDAVELPSSGLIHGKRHNLNYQYVRNHLSKIFLWKG